jgi:hypothetical protein
MNELALGAKWMIMALTMNGNVMDKDHLQFATYGDCQKKVVELNGNVPVVALLTTPKFPRVCIPIKDVVKDVEPVKVAIKAPAKVVIKAPVKVAIKEPVKVAVKEPIKPKANNPQPIVAIAPSHQASADIHKPSRHL